MLINMIAVKYAFKDDSVQHILSVGGGIQCYLTHVMRKAVFGV